MSVLKRITWLPIFASGLGTMGVGQSAHADFFTDSQAQMELRNFYFSRDFRQPGGSNGKSQAREWGQAAILKLQSGYTPGVIGFGVDMTGMLGVRLDSSADRSGTGLFPSQSDGSSVDEYTKAGVTAKAKISKTTIKVGALMFRNTVLQSPDARLLPQMFKGSLLESKEIDGLSLQAGRITEVVGVDSTDWTHLTSNYGGDSDEFILAGGDYSWRAGNSVGLHYGKLDGVYEQGIFNTATAMALGHGTLKTDLRLESAREDGSFRRIDNRAAGLGVTYLTGAHSFTVGYQKIMGDDPYPYVVNSDPWLVNFIQVLPFANTGERSWQFRYDYDLAAWGFPGLTFMNRYVSGDQIHLSNGDEGHEWERNSELTYFVQSGTFKSLSLKWRNATVRSTFGNDLDENRIIVSYPLSLL
ncbi:MAG TPA: OprD family porin [Pseudomonas sp.]|uniref:OprD family porin n=1 Tax=Pseudomonas sp. TaxID=306 RepID=UPI002ED7C2A2